MKRLAYLLPLAALLAIVACKDDKKTTEPEVVIIDTASETKIYTAAVGDAEFNDANMAKVFNHYIHLKTAMVNTNSAAAASAAANFAASIAGMEVDVALTKAVANIEKLDDIEEQRVAFETVTKQMESMLEGALASGTIYKQFCPMAFGNTGAYWLSNSKDIMNPYFGDKMLKCGRVASEIK